jgi:hypothetical protein
MFADGHARGPGGLAAFAVLAGLVARFEDLVE